LTHRMRVEVYVNGVRVREVDATYDGDWADFNVFVTHGRFQAAVHRFAHRLLGIFA